MKNKKHMPRDERKYNPIFENPFRQWIKGHTVFIHKENLKLEVGKQQHFNTKHLLTCSLVKSNFEEEK